MGANLTPRYSDSSGNLNANKRNVVCACRASFPGFFYLDFSTYWYPDKAQQRSWGPDFTYGFGLFDWLPRRLSVTCSNFSGNRCKDALATFMAGAIQLSQD